MSEPIRISSRLRDYSVEVRSDAWLQELASSPGAITVVDENVWRLHADGILEDVADPVVLPIDEDRKTFETVSWLYDRLLERGLRRNGTVVSIGGGITQDISGFAVSTLYRGVRWAYAPTTLLAQADSCIGGKTSLNYGSHKNILGTMYPPERIVVDPRFLDTLSRDDFFSGLGEVVKLHVLAGEDSAQRLQGAMDALVARDASAVAEAVSGSLRIKLPYIEEDEFDRGRRNLLNYGHCFGHALEAATAFALPHGQAVVIGMLLAQTVAERRGLTSAAFRAELEKHLFLPVLVARPKLDAAGREAVIEAMRYDKKRTSAGLALVMCCDGFRFLQVGDVSDAEALAALDNLESW